MLVVFLLICVKSLLVWEIFILPDWVLHFDAADGMCLTTVLW